MKKILGLMLLVGLAPCCFAQTVVRQPVGTTKANPDSTTIQTTKLSSSPNKTKAALKMAELIITRLDVAFYNSNSTDSTKRYLEIYFTVMNDGVVDVPLNQIAFQGMILEYQDRPPGIPGGGSTLSTTGGVLKPGASASGSFRFYTMAPVSQINIYKLHVDNHNWIKEIDENNNVRFSGIRRY